MLALRFVCATLLAAVLMALTIGPAQAQLPEEVKALGHRVNALNKAGKYQEAIPLAEQYEQLVRDRLGAEHPERAVALHILAVFYNFTGRLPEAEAAAKLCLLIREKIFGPNHSMIADTLILLATIDHTLGRKPEYEARIRRALAIRETTLGHEHLLVADALYRLAAVCQFRPECAAEAELKRVITIREKGLGPDDRTTVTSRFALGIHYLQTGKLRDAEPIYRQGFVIGSGCFPTSKRSWEVGSLALVRSLVVKAASMRPESYIFAL